MSALEPYDAPILRSGTGAKLIARHLEQSGHKTVVLERADGLAVPFRISPACPSKNEIASAKVAQVAHHGGP